MHKAEWHCLVEVVFNHYTQLVHNFAHNIMLKFCSFQISSGAHREGCCFCICLAFPKIYGILALLHKEGVLCISCTVACPDAIKWVTSSSRNVVCTAKARSASA